MTDVYKRLAKKLDEIPNGFPSTKGGVELRILRKIFTPEEAELTLRMTLNPETVEDVAARFGKPVSEMQAILDGMVEKGHIGSEKISGRHRYMLAPFIAGIYEFQLNRMDKALAELFEEYLPILAKTVGGHQPALFRVVPVNSQIKAELNVPRYDDLRRMVKESKSFHLLECICRKQRALTGHPCKHDPETCLGFSAEEDAFDRYTLGRVISMDEAVSVLDKAEEAGLVQSMFNFEKGPPTHVCLCCECCCPLVRGIKDFDAPYMLAKGNFLAEIEQETCSVCGVCAEERCPMEAIIEDGDGYKVIPKRCVGCGVCAPTCPTESIKLVPRLESQRDKPPADMREWYTTREAMREMKIKAD